MFGPGAMPNFAIARFFANVRGVPFKVGLFSAPKKTWELINYTVVVLLFFALNTLYSVSADQ